MYAIKRAHIYSLMFLALVIHMALLDHIQISGSKPDIFLIMVVFIALFFGQRAGFESGVIAGVMKDLFTLDYFGMNVFILAVTGLVIGSINTKFSRDSKGAHAFIVAVFTVAAMSLHYILFSIFSNPIGMRFTNYLSASIIPTVIYTSIIAIPIFSKLIGLYNLRDMDELI